MSKKLFNNMQEVYEYCKTKLFNRMMQRMRNREEAEDVTSDIFEQIATHCEWFIRQDEKHQRDYLELTVRKVTTEHEKLLELEQKVDFSEYSYLEKLISEDRLVFMEEDAVRSHFNVLSEKERAVAEKYYNENKGISQIAAEENTSENTISKRLSRAREKMRKE